MTDSEFFLIAGYLAKSSRNTLIQVELHPGHRIRFENNYQRLTRNYPLTLPNNSYYIWGPGVDKWGRQSRVYFTSNINIPLPLTNILEPRGVNTRPGYELTFDKRFNGNRIIDRLFGIGFVIGNPQNEQRIRSFIPLQFISDFNNGFNL